MAYEGLKEKFDRDGYAIIEDFLTEEEMSSLRDQCWKIVEDMKPEEHCTVFSTVDMRRTDDDYFMTSGDKIRFFFEEDAVDEKGKLTVDKHLAVNKMGHALHALDPAFKKVTFSDKVKNVAKSLELVDPVVVQSMYIFKQPGIGGQVIPHQDATYLHSEPQQLVGLWIALEDATLENGCLWFIPGSHKNGLDGGRRMIRNPDRSSSGGNTIHTCPMIQYDQDKFVAGEVKKGTLVLIHGLVVHKSEHNKSSKSRHIYTFHIYDQHNSTYSPENWLQPTPELPFPSLYSTPPV